MVALQFIEGTSSNETGLRKHLGTVHNMKHLLFKSQNCSNAKYEITATEKSKFHDAAIEAVIKDGLSFGIFRKPGMAKFLNRIKPGYKGPHRKTVRRLVGSKFNNYKT